jgi:hypothetical protein
VRRPFSRLLRLHRRSEGSVRLQALGLVGEGRGQHRVPLAFQTGVAQDADQLVGRQLAILVAERIERRTDDGGSPGQVVRDVLGGREYRPVVGLGVRLQEVPGGLGGRQVLVVPDVTAPDAPHARFGLEHRPHRQRLRIVDDEDVVWTEMRLQRLGILPVHRFEQLAIAVEERRITVPVDQIVQPLGEGEERRLIGAEHRPARGQAELVEQGDHLRKHLRYATPLGGRVDHPDGPPSERRDQHGGLDPQGLDRVGQVRDRRVVIQRPRGLEVDHLNHRRLLVACARRRSAQRSRSASNPA